MSWKDKFVTSDAEKAAIFSLAAYTSVVLYYGFRVDFGPETDLVYTLRHDIFFLRWRYVYNRALVRLVFLVLVVIFWNLRLIRLYSFAFAPVGVTHRQFRGLISNVFYFLFFLLDYEQSILIFMCLRQLLYLLVDLDTHRATHIELERGNLYGIFESLLFLEQHMDFISLDSLWTWLALDCLTHALLESLYETMVTLLLFLSVHLYGSLRWLVLIIA